MPVLLDLIQKQKVVPKSVTKKKKKKAKNNNSKQETKVESMMQYMSSWGMDPTYSN